MMGVNQVEAIPYKDFKEKIQTVKQELAKDRYIEIWDKFIYSAEKWRDNKKAGKIAVLDIKVREVS